jgi:hypothetical protein
MDYSKWVERLRTFILTLQERSPPEQRDRFSIEIAPPLDRDELDELAESLDCGLPAPLRRFLATGASSISFRYAWPTPDYEFGEEFCPADQLADWRDECVEYSRKSWLTELDWPLDRAFWRHALQLVQYPDGDGLALWVHAPELADPPVIYLKHDDESLLLSRNLDEFLEQWEMLGYISLGELEDCRNPQNGFLDATTPKALEWRRKLGLLS